MILPCTTQAHKYAQLWCRVYVGALKQRIQASIKCAWVNVLFVSAFQNCFGPCTQVNIYTQANQQTYRSQHHRHC